MIKSFKIFESQQNDIYLSYLDFHFERVQNAIKNRLSLGELEHKDINTETYFVVVYSIRDTFLLLFKDKDKEIINKKIDELKKSDIISKIYVEKLSKGAQKYTRIGDDNWKVENIDLNKYKLKNYSKGGDPNEKYKFLIDFDYHMRRDKNYETREFIGTLKHFDNYINKLYGDESYRKVIGIHRFKNVDGDWVKLS